MSSIPNDNIRSADSEREETVRLVIARLIFVVFASVVCWCVIGGILYATSFPALGPTPEGQPLAGPNILSVRLAAAILIAHFISVVGIQLFAPVKVIRSRLVSNTMFGALVISLCASVSVAGQMVPPDAVPYMKQAIGIAFHPAFVIANFVLCALAGVLSYRYREVRAADIIEIYWSLGLMFLFGLSIGLVMAVASS